MTVDERKGLRDGDSRPKGTRGEVIKLKRLCVGIKDNIRVIFPFGFLLLNPVQAETPQGSAAFCRFKRKGKCRYRHVVQENCLHVNGSGYAHSYGLLHVRV